MDVDVGAPVVLSFLFERGITGFIKNPYHLAGDLAAQAQR